VDGRTETLIGLSLVPERAAWPQLLELAQVADRTGLDLLGIQDHPYQHRFLDTFALIGTLLARTERIRIFPDVANLPLRPPSVLAKTATALDVMSGGRFELGLGAGAFWDAIEAMGGPRRAPGEAVNALAEAIDVIRLMWSGERTVSYEGEHYHVRGVHPGDAPPHPIGIWVGAYGPRMLRLIGRRADGWVPSYGRAPVEDLRSAHTVIDEAAVEAGRDPAAIQRVLNIGGQITGPGAGHRPEPGRSVGQLGGGLAGPPEYWLDLLGGLTEIGFDAFVFWPTEPSAEQVELLPEEVARILRARG
jgi:alkanesulfonate monooxygenase SsuD/methylene tetrahydromethanopterin reductase-like flavin-dependent oxidoreductase (luciferase family)